VSGHRFIHGDWLFDGFLRLQRGTGEEACFARSFVRGTGRVAGGADMRVLPFGLGHGVACLRFFSCCRSVWPFFLWLTKRVGWIVGRFFEKLQYVSVGFI